MSNSNCLPISLYRQLNIVHRDVKPENILIDRDGHVVLADFGLCAILKSPNEFLLDQCGSNPYMSPEVLQGKAYGKEADIWSYGVLATELLTGRHPFKSNYGWQTTADLIKIGIPVIKSMKLVTRQFCSDLLRKKIGDRMGI